MNGRSNTKELVILFIVLIVLSLQFSSKFQMKRFEHRIDTLEKTFSSTPAANLAAGNQNYYTPDENDGDWLIWAMPVEPKTLNLISVNVDIYSRWIMFPNVFEPLMEYDFDEVRMKPMLAKSCEISSDGLEITYTLRDDIHFSDGVPITADDVVFTYKTIINPLIDAADVAQQFIEVKDVEKIDSKTVKFQFHRPYFKAMEISSLWTIGVFPKHIYDFKDPQEFNRRISNPVGSGPYVFEKWDSGEKAVFTRNENYWNPAAMPKIKKRIYKFIINDKARIQAIRSGDVDMMIPAPEQYVDAIKDEKFTKDFKCLAYWSPGTPFYFIGWNADTPFFADRNVRLAMTQMIDRKSIIEHLLKKSGKEITGPFYLYGPENDPNIQPWSYDVANANRLLDEAGWKDTDGDGIRDKNGVPFRFKFSYSADYVLYQNIANVLKDSAAKVGIELVPEPVEWSILITNLPDHKFESVIMGWGGDIIQDEYQLFHSSQTINRGSNYVNFKNAQADELLEEIRQTIDEPKRIELSRKLHGLLHNEQPYTFLFTRPTYRIIAPRFENVTVHKLGLREEEWFVPKEKQRYK
ncbi:MAG: ABC transporter substrate-binding protein [Planctomycetaceae bacterium]|nr:ABC transporter substrate-binding protein [Planctomycetaceae bacterium]